MTCRRGFSVAICEFMPTHLIATAITLPLVGVQTCCLDQHAFYDGSNVYKIWCCIVDVHAAMMIYNNLRANLVVCVHT